MSIVCVLGVVFCCVFLVVSVFRFCGNLPSQIWAFRCGGGVPRLDLTHSCLVLHLECETDASALHLFLTHVCVSCQLLCLVDNDNDNAY